MNNEHCEHREQKRGASFTARTSVNSQMGIKVFKQ